MGEDELAPFLSKIYELEGKSCDHNIRLDYLDSWKETISKKIEDFETSSINSSSFDPEKCMQTIKSSDSSLYFTSASNGWNTVAYPAYATMNDGYITTSSFDEAISAVNKVKFDGSILRYLQTDTIEKIFEEVCSNGSPETVKSLLEEILAVAIMPEKFLLDAVAYLKPDEYWKFKQMHGQLIQNGTYKSIKLLFDLPEEK